MQNDELGPAGNLRRDGVCFHRGPGKVCTARDEFFLSRVIPLWNKLLKKPKEAKSLNSFKAELDMLDSFTVYAVIISAFTNAGFNEKSHLQHQNVLIYLLDIL